MSKHKKQPKRKISHKEAKKRHGGKAAGGLSQKQGPDGTFVYEPSSAACTDQVGGK